MTGPPPITASEFVPVNIAFEPANRSLDLPPDRIHVSFPPLPTEPAGLGNVQPDVVFARISGRSRLPWQVVRSLPTDPALTPALTQSVKPRIVEDFVEPLPPAVLGALISTIISPQMDQLVGNITQATGNAAQISQRTAPVNDVNTALRNLAVNFRSLAGNPTGNQVLSTTLIAQVRQAARAHTVQFEGNSTDMLSALQKISDDVVTRQVATNPNASLRQHLIVLATSSLFDGFQAFNLFPQRNFIYRFTFTDSGSVGGNFIILNGSFGAFLVNIDKLDQATGLA